MTTGEAVSRHDRFDTAGLFTEFDTKKLIQSKVEDWVLWLMFEVSSLNTPAMIVATIPDTETSATARKGLYFRS